MDAETSPADLADAAPDPDPAEAQAAETRAMLRELAKIGMNMARALERRAVAEAEIAEAAAAAVARGELAPAAAMAPPAGRREDLSLSFARITRAVRLNLALDERLAEGRTQARMAAEARRKDGEAKAAAGTETDGDGTGKGLRIYLNKSTVQDAVEQLIDREAPERDAERLLDALFERLADAPDSDDFEETPISALIARVCADLGLTPDWDLWEGEDWAEQEVDSRAPGSPYAATARRRARAEAAQWRDDEDSG